MAGKWKKIDGIRVQQRLQAEQKAVKERARRVKKAQKERAKAAAKQKAKEEAEAKMGGNLEQII